MANANISDRHLGAIYLKVATAILFHYLSCQKEFMTVFHQRLNLSWLFPAKNFVDRGWLNLSSSLCPCFPALFYKKLTKWTKPGLPLALKNDISMPGIKLIWQCWLYVLMKFLYNHGEIELHQFSHWCRLVIHPFLVQLFSSKCTGT